MGCTVSHNNDLLLAAQKGDLHIINEICSTSGAAIIKQLEEVDAEKRTALHWASTGGYTEIVKVLCEAGMCF